MSSAEKKLFCKVLKEVRFPDGYTYDIHCNIHVNEKIKIGLTNHDNHVLLQHLLSLAVRSILLEEVIAMLIRVSNFFKHIYSPIIRISEMQKIETEIAETLCLLETIFLSSFFIYIMVHWMVHLPAQARMIGPIHFRNMYLIER